MLIFSGCGAFSSDRRHRKIDGRCRQYSDVDQADACQAALCNQQPHRLLKTISQLSEVLGENRNCVVVKEISKIYERYFRGTLGGLTQQIKPEVIKGEFVIVVGNDQPIFREPSETFNSSI